MILIDRQLEGHFVCRSAGRGVFSLSLATHLLAPWPIRNLTSSFLPAVGMISEMFRFFFTRRKPILVMSWSLLPLSQ